VVSVVSHPWPACSPPATCGRATPSLPRAA
jgi:hypothetical protein